MSEGISQSVSQPVSQSVSLKKTPLFKSRSNLLEMFMIVLKALLDLVILQPILPGHHKGIARLVSGKVQISMIPNIQYYHTV